MCTMGIILSKFATRPTLPGRDTSTETGRSRVIRLVYIYKEQYAHPRLPLSKLMTCTQWPHLRLPLLVAKQQERRRHDGVHDHRRLRVAADLGDRRLLQLEYLRPDALESSQLYDDELGGPQLVMELRLERVVLHEVDSFLELRKLP